MAPLALCLLVLQTLSVQFGARAVHRDHSPTSIQDEGYFQSSSSYDQIASGQIATSNGGDGILTKSKQLSRLANSMDPDSMQSSQTFNQVVPASDKSYSALDYKAPLSLQSSRPIKQEVPSSIQTSVTSGHDFPTSVSLFQASGLEVPSSIHSIRTFDDVPAPIQSFTTSDNIPLSMESFKNSDEIPIPEPVTDIWDYKHPKTFQGTIHAGSMQHFQKPGDDTQLYSDRLIHSKPAKLTQYKHGKIKYYPEYVTEDTKTNVPPLVQSTKSSESFKMSLGRSYQVDKNSDYFGIQNLANPNSMYPNIYASDPTYLMPSWWRDYPRIILDRNPNYLQKYKHINLKGTATASNELTEKEVGQLSQEGSKLAVPENQPPLGELRHAYHDDNKSKQEPKGASDLSTGRYAYHINADNQNRVAFLPDSDHAAKLPIYTETNNDEFYAPTDILSQDSKYSHSVKFHDANTVQTALPFLNAKMNQLHAEYTTNGDKNVPQSKASSGDKTQKYNHKDVVFPQVAKVQHRGMADSRIQSEEKWKLPHVGDWDPADTPVATAVLGSVMLFLILVVVVLALRVHWRNRHKQNQEWIWHPIVQPPAATSNAVQPPHANGVGAAPLYAQGEPVRIKTKGLLERRGSNTSLTLDLGGSMDTPDTLSPAKECTHENFLMSAGNRMSRRQLRSCLRNPRLLHEEFWTIPTNHPDRCPVPGCTSKNRYQAVLPNEHTRVLLKTAKPTHPSNQYINANYIAGYDGEERAFLATQGPLSNTINDLWHLVLQERSPAIVMITRLKERGRTKCETYIPAYAATYGDITVTVKQVVQKNGYAIRQILLQHDEEVHTTLHFWFTSWPDHKTPASARQILAMVADVKLAKKEVKGPVIVHCSAGIGRTGCFIAISTAITQILEEDCVDILSIVCQMRLDRGGMVQTAEQYEFIHRAVALYEASLPLNAAE